MASKSEEPVEINMVIHQDRPGERAILASTSGDPDDAVWLPRSQIEYDDPREAGAVTTIMMPQWLAEERGIA